MQILLKRKREWISQKFDLYASSNVRADGQIVMVVVVASGNRTEVHRRLEVSSAYVEVV